MNIVLGIAMTPTTVGIVVVDGEKADGVALEHDTFDIGPSESSTSSATDHVIAAIMGTREGAAAGGHRLVSTGVTWSDRAEAAKLRQGLANRGIDGVTLVSQLQAAGALAQASGSLVGHDNTALLLVEPDNATLAVVNTTDASIVKVDSRPLTDPDAIPTLTDMMTALNGHSSQPDGIFVIGSGHDLSEVIQHASDVLSIPVSAPADGEIALARGAALATANLAGSDPSTAADLAGVDPATEALAYSQDTDALSATAAAADDVADAQVSAYGPHAGKPFVLVGSAMAAIFTVGVVSLAITLAVSIRPTAETRPSPDFGAAAPTVAAPQAPAPTPAAAPPTVAPPPPAPPTPATEAVSPPVLEPNVAPPTLAQAPVPKHAPLSTPAPEAPPPAEAAPAPPPVAVPDNLVGPPAYGPGPAYIPAPAYGPGPGYVQQPATPMIPIIPGILSIGPAPGYGTPNFGPRYTPPQREWPSGPIRGPSRHGGGMPPWMWPED
jgi:outer membrane biosynthesis protein TonB